MRTRQRTDMSVADTQGMPGAHRMRNPDFRSRTGRVAHQNGRDPDMPRLSFLAGLAAGYVLGARAGKQRYAQIKKVSGKVWQSKPVQNQVAAAKENARTKAAPVVADFVADAAKAAGEKLRASHTITSRIAGGSDRTTRTDPWVASDSARGEDPWASATKN